MFSFSEEIYELKRLSQLNIILFERKKAYRISRFDDFFYKQRMIISKRKYHEICFIEIYYDMRKYNKSMQHFYITK